MTSQGNSGMGVSWTVTSQYQSTDVSTPGRLVEGYTIHFRTGQGHDGSVFVPLAQYNPATVKSAIASQAALMDAVGNLSSDS